MSKPKKPYNGHPSRKYWNVSLWIANDEPLYRLAVACIRATRSLDRATDLFIAEVGATHTPDGVRYCTAYVRRALAGLEIKRGN